MIGQTIEHTEIDGVIFSLIPIIPFEEWIEKKSSGMKKFEILSRRDKEKIFLRWKWGFNDERANEESDLSEKATLYLFKDSDLSLVSESWRFHIEHKRQFDRICYETKKRIGIIQERNPLVDKLTKEFDAKEY